MNGGVDFAGQFVGQGEAAAVEQKRHVAAGNVDKRLLIIKRREGLVKHLHRYVYPYIAVDLPSLADGTAQRDDVLSAELFQLVVHNHVAAPMHRAGGGMRGLSKEMVA